LDRIRQRALRMAALPTGMLLAGTARAHAPSDGSSHGAPTLSTAVTLDPLLLVPLLAAMCLHALGIMRLRRRSAQAVGSMALSMVVLGWCALLLALVWPLDAYGEWSLAAHMAQHMLLMAVAPPLLLLALPPAAVLHAMPTSLVRAAPGLWRGIASPRWGGGIFLTIATLLQIVVMWLWHWPPVMQAALVSDPLHYLMHASFLASGLLFWWCLLLSIRAPSPGYASGATAVVAVMMQMGLMGGLLTFSRRVLYPFYDGRVDQLGLSALEDQQLAGLIMWVPAAVPYLVGGLWLLHSWLERLQQRTEG
jgi:putative membrane protein